MARIGQRQDMIAGVEAALTYVVDTGTKPITNATAEGGGRGSRIGTYEQRNLLIQDGRVDPDRFTLEREGFVLTRHDTTMKDFYDRAELDAVYSDEVAELVKKTSGAKRVLVFDHTLRADSEDTQDDKKVREPVRFVHNDYTVNSAPRRVRDFLPDEADELIKRRFCVIQVWRPTGPPVETAPLAICDAQSIAPGDLVTTERRSPGRVGETYQVTYNPAHRWYYFPKMRRNEALVFKCYDSETDGRSRFTAHAAFDDPNSPDGAAPRESIESRLFAFF